MITLIDNLYATLLVYPEKKIVHHQFHRFIFGDEFREVLARGADAFEEYQCTKWLSDDRGNSTVLPADAEWGQIYWETRIMKASWKHWALILPEEIVGRMNMEQLIERYSQMGVNVQVFSDPEQAMTWLEQQ